MLAGSSQVHVTAAGAQPTCINTPECELRLQSMNQSAGVKHFKQLTVKLHHHVTSLRARHLASVNAASTLTSHPVFLSSMAATLCVKFLLKPGWLPLTQTVRHGSKAVTRHRRPMHILKQKLLAVTKYIPPPRGPPPGAYPSQVKRVQEDTPLMLIMKRDLKKVFEDYKMIAVVQNNACNSEDMLMLKHRLYKHGITVKLFPNQVTRSFLKDSVYCNMAPLFIGPTLLFVSKEPKVKEMLKTLRASPQMTLLGASIDNTLLSAQGVVSYSKLPSVTVVQGELVSGLTMLTSTTASLLQRHPTHLSALLQQYVKQQSSGDSAEEAT